MVNVDLDHLVEEDRGCRDGYFDCLRDADLGRVDNCYTYLCF